MRVGAGIAGNAVLLGLIVGCPPEAIDPSPPLDTSEGSEANNPLLDDAPLSCEERKTAAEEHVLAAVAESVEGCTSDTDCALVDPETACYDSCPLAVSTHGEARVRLAASDANERWCHAFAVECRELLAPPPDCSEAPPRCDEGRCVAGGPDE